jgi:hypothetical protein
MTTYNVYNKIRYVKLFRMKNSAVILKDRSVATLQQCIFPLMCHVGRAIAQAVNRWLPTGAARFQTRV